MGIRLEAGKRYVTRSGWITPTICKDLEADADGSMRFYCGIESWSATGGVFLRGEESGDLVAEHVELAPLPDVPDDHELMVVAKMEQYGGIFAKNLANCYRFADSENRGKIRNTFREYWMKYAELVAAEVSKANGGAN